MAGVSETRKLYWHQSKLCHQFESLTYAKCGSKSSRTQADRARKVLYWSPNYGQTSFEQEIEEVLKLMVEEQEQKATAL